MQLKNYEKALKINVCTKCKYNVYHKRIVKIKMQMNITNMLKNVIKNDILNN
jgi:hypothetical protein